MTEPAGLTVLAVDHSADGRRTLARTLRRDGWTVLEASADEALRLARDGPDLVIVDDAEVCRRLKNDPGTWAVPVVQVIADPRHTPPDACADGGADAWLSGPLKPAEVMAAARALVRLRHTESRYRTAARQWRAMFDAISDAVCLLSPGGVVLRCNRAFAALLGLPFGAIVERPLFELMPELAVLAPSLSGGGTRPAACELEVGARWLRVRLDPAPEDPEAPQRVCVITDLTDRRRAERALAATGERLRGVLESITDAYVRFDAQWRVIEANQRVRELFGDGPEELVGVVFWERFPQSVGGDCHHGYLRALATRTPQHFEARSTIRPGRWYEVHAYPEDGGGLTVYYRDVTLRHEADATLRQQTAHFRAVTEALPCLVWTCDAEGRIEDANEGARAYVAEPGRTAAPAGRRALRVVAEDAPRYEAIRARAATEGVPCELELRLGREDGASRWFFARLVPVRDATGAVRRWLGTALDIDDRRRQHERLERLRALTAALSGALSREQVAAQLVQASLPAFGATAGAVAMLSEDRRHLELLHAAGIPEELVAGWRRIPCDSPTLMAEALNGSQPRVLPTWQARVSRYPHHALLRLAGTDGAAIAIPLVIERHAVGVLSLAFAGPRYPDEEEQAFMMSLGLQAAQALERARLYDGERRRAMQLQSLAAAAVAINASLSTEEILAVVTDQARAILGAGWCVTTLHTGAADAPLTAVSRSGESGAWRDYHERPGTPDLHALVMQHGRPVRLSRDAIEAMPAWREAPESVREFGPMEGWMGVPLAATDGRHLGIIQVADAPDGAFSGLDEAMLVQLAQMTSVAVESSRLYHRARAAEEHLRADAAQLEQAVASRTQELRDSHARLETFSYSVAHNLRAPLRWIHGFAEAMLEEHGPELPHGARDLGTRVIDAAARMDHLIADLLAYARLDRITLTRVPVTVAEVVSDACVRMAPEIERCGARIELAVPAGLPRVRAHHAVLVQVVEHLLGNALKFVPPGAVPAVRIEAVPRARTVEVSVIDHGIGIAEEHFDRIFQPFERLHRQEAYPGTGVGLAMVQRAVERLGGRVGVSSRVGQGSRFWFELPSMETAQ